MTLAQSSTISTNPITLRLPATADLSDDEFFEFCQLNRDLRIERTAEHQLVIMTPTGSETDERNFDLIGQLWAWARQNGTGVGFGSSGGFTLPNGAIRSPDASWVSKERWEALTAEQRKRFAKICTDFVVKLRSESDALQPLQDKLAEYMANGASLGWLIDRQNRQVYIYQGNQAPVCLNSPANLKGDPLMPGFVLDLKTIW
jgi:Uma2 family endonuclease